MYLIPFSHLHTEDIPVAGGKGANLGELTCASLPVPPGAVLTTDAYRAYLTENSIDIPALLAARGPEGVREAFLSGHFPKDVLEPLRTFLSASQSRLAVRSSATAEDLGDASFAGQQETFLNVRGEAALLDAIRGCYASLWGDRAVQYRASQGFTDAGIALAVVLQEMVESEVAGVLFTKDPTGNTQDLLIDAAYGLGEAVVSGLVTPDAYRLSCEGKVLQRTLGEKAVEILYGESGVVRHNVSSDRQRRFALTDTDLHALYLLAMQVEAHYGRPMDLEWALREGKLYLLQARPITTLTKPTFTESDFVGLPAPKPAAGKLRESVLFNLEKLPVPYYPLDYDFGDLIGKQKEVLFKENGIVMQPMVPIDRDGISSFSLISKGLRVSRDLRHLPGTVRELLQTDDNREASLRAISECETRLSQVHVTEDMSSEEVRQGLEEMQKLVTSMAYGRFRYAVFPQMLENRRLTRALKKFAPEKNAYDLLEGLHYVTADINQALSALADFIRSDAQRQKDVLTLPYATLCTAHPELAARFRDFLSLYGHRSDRNCYCFTARTWNEDPDRFLLTLRTVVRTENTERFDFDSAYARYTALLEKAEKQLSAKEAAAFRKHAEAARHDHVIREKSQYLCESAFALCRKLLHVGSLRLGVPESDLLYLFSNELYPALSRGHLSEEELSLIAKRKEKRPLAEAYWEYSLSVILSGSADGIQGVSGSTGTATGKVRIVHGPEEFARLAPGEILVCPLTDPEWTPLFTLAAGVVVDTGG
ncbi:MAG: phosphoenolpyruvate synthase, partial [Clostridia bacterium]|nr:phosphoenolpyruvate synthase [Clostridia bacterium]